MTVTKSNVILIFILCFTGYSLSSEVISGRYGVFQFTHQVMLPGNPDQIYDAITGDISGWWDHSFSEKPLKFFIEPKPGGGFYEIIDESGDGILHAVVIFAQRGKMLRFDGPLGLTGQAVQGVYTYSFEAMPEDSTQLKLDAHLSGEIDAEVAKKLDYPIFMAVSERGGKNNSGDYISLLDDDGNLMEDDSGHPIIDQDLVNYELTYDDLKDAKNISDDQLCIAEAFVRFAQKNNFDFWRVS